MKIKLIIFVTSLNEKGSGEAFIKEFTSEFRPVVGDIIDDPGFHPAFHNGYEVVKVTVNYATSECYVSLKPLAIELEDITFDSYVNHLKANEWKLLSKED